MSILVKPMLESQLGVVHDRHQSQLGSRQRGDRDEELERAARHDEIAQLPYVSFDDYPDNHGDADVDADDHPIQCLKIGGKNIH